MKLPDINQLRKEKKIWKEAGQPIRSPERIKELYSICLKCPHYISLMDSMGQCEICTCILRPAGQNLNKLAFSTTRCPKEPPEWVEEIGYEQKELELPEDNPSPNVLGVPNRRKTGGCNCG